MRRKKATLEGIPHSVIERNLGHRLGGVEENYIGHTPIPKLFEYNQRII